METSESKKNIIILVIVILGVIGIGFYLYSFFKTFSVAKSNVDDLYSKAKLNSFVTEVKSIYIQAENQYIVDGGINSVSEITYGRKNGVNCENYVSISVRDKLDYYVKVSSGTKTTALIVSDGVYSFEYRGEDLNINDITSDSIKKASESNIVVPSCK